MAYWVATVAARARARLTRLACLGFQHLIFGLITAFLVQGVCVCEISFLVCIEADLRLAVLNGRLSSGTL